MVSSLLTRPGLCLHSEQLSLAFGCASARVEALEVILSSSKMQNCLTPNHVLPLASSVSASKNSSVFNCGH